MASMLRNPLSIACRNVAVVEQLAKQTAADGQSRNGFAIYRSSHGGSPGVSGQ